jgi:hypothetical protein
MPFPTSNVRIVRVLTVDSFYGCDPCADGEHGSILDDGTCACCRWLPIFKAGDTLEVSS